LVASLHRNACGEGIIRMTRSHTTPDLLQMAADDNIAIALRDLSPGEHIDSFGVAITEPVRSGHKIALTDIAEGEQVLRYGQVIGTAIASIASGKHIHTHNLGFVRAPTKHPTELGSATVWQPPTVEISDGFLGFHRDDGHIGTRNYVGILTTVNCSATVARRIADSFSTAEVRERFPNVDGVIALTHKSGCSIPDGSSSMAMLRRTIAGYARHPNMAAVLVIGLGCEDNQIEAFFEDQGLTEGPDLKFFYIQDVGGTRSAIERGREIIEKMLGQANEFRRRLAPASALSIGLQCGGSDGFSGVSANPALGAAVDRIVAVGGRAILSETPEIYGAESLLLARAANSQVQRDLTGLLEWWETYTADEPKGLDNNPSPGNKTGGLTTILEKSLGAVAKGGTAPLSGVYRYAEPISQKGLVFMDSPGYDPVSITGQVASGANLICFTTGRGSCFGCRPAPSIKLATNTRMFQRMADDMDMNCGVILDGKVTIDSMGADIYQTILRVASGEPTKSEEHGYGEDEFAPWHLSAWL
jgi:altronate hydrolase